MSEHSWSWASSGFFVCPCLFMVPPLQGRYICSFLLLPCSSAFHVHLFFIPVSRTPSLLRQGLCIFHLNKHKTSGTTPRIRFYITSCLFILQCNLVLGVAGILSNAISQKFRRQSYSNIFFNFDSQKEPLIFR